MLSDAALPLYNDCHKTVPIDLKYGALSAANVIRNIFYDNWYRSYLR